MTKRFYVKLNGIPLHEQPADGYTRLGAIQRVQREVKWAHDNLGLSWEEAKADYDIYDGDFFNTDYSAREAF